MRMTRGGGFETRRRTRVWSEQLPLALGALLVVAGAVIVVAVLLQPATGQPGASGLASGTSAPTPAASGPVASAASPTPTPEPTASATAQATPRVLAATAVDLTWRSLDFLPGTNADPATQTVRVAGLARGPAGYVAVGQIVDGFLTETGATGPVHPAIWTSPDGNTWTLADARSLGDAVPSDIAATPTALLVVASSPQATILLRSSGDGAWEQATPLDARIARIAAVDGGFVAIGTRISTNRQAIWTSADGTTWDRAWESEVAVGEFLTTVSVRPDGSVVVGGTQLGLAGGVHAAAVVSTDGTTWTRVDPTGLPASMGFDAIGIGADGAWYGAGFDGARGGIGVWRSTNGVTWQQTSFGPAQETELPGDTGSATAVFGFDGRTIVLAYTSCCGDPPQRALVSTDGRSWARADRSWAVRSTQLTALLVEPDRVLAVGGLNRGAGVWLATAAPRNGVAFATELAPVTQADVCGGGPALRVKVTVDRSGVVARIRLVRLDETGVELSGVIWPYGWQAADGSTLTVSNATGTAVFREGDEITLSGGLVTGGSYHVCQLNGQPVWGG
jgi:hypothetical protein